MASSSKFQVKITGQEAIKQKLLALGRAWPKAVQQALFQETKELESEAVDRTPRDKGTLRGSYETTVKRSGRGFLARILVGGPAAPYALAVHERVEVFHKIGGPLFLQSVWHEVRHTISDRLGRRIRENHGLK